MKQGLVQIYSGEDKGKTTSSVGLALGVLEYGFYVTFCSFFKLSNENRNNKGVKSRKEIKF